MQSRGSGVKPLVANEGWWLKLEIEEIKKKLKNQDKNIELVFTYLDELIEKQ